ncbi:hypothetical protein WAI453_003537 [Rhynchosporium graminicola]|uniref:Uncharacterized protein n=1 Tax=Rhynchosporium graminicola TaxID=2792576 RepID=A0A1E1KP89_9HELO|nr:uncharacterized protein RCO7_01629 [Rhynchosporium commune]
MSSPGAPVPHQRHPSSTPFLSQPSKLELRSSSSSPSRYSTSPNSRPDLKFSTIELKRDRQTRTRYGNRWFPSLRPRYNPDGKKVRQGSSYPYPSGGNRLAFVRRDEDDEDMDGDKEVSMSVFGDWKEDGRMDRAIHEWRRANLLTQTETRNGDKKDEPQGNEIKTEAELGTLEGTGMTGMVSRRNNIDFDFDFIMADRQEHLDHRNPNKKLQRFLPQHYQNSSFEKPFDGKGFDDHYCEIMYIRPIFLTGSYGSMDLRAFHSQIHSSPDCNAVPDEPGALMPNNEDHSLVGPTYRGIRANDFNASLKPRVKMIYACWRDIWSSGLAIPLVDRILSVVWGRYSS